MWNSLSSLTIFGVALSDWQLDIRQLVRRFWIRISFSASRRTGCVHYAFDCGADVIVWK
jgi:hypothetical protein